MKKVSSSIIGLIVASSISWTLVVHAQAPTVGLVGYWSLNEGAGPAAGDGSGFGHGGTLVGGPTWVAGKSGGALSFSGSSYVSIGDIPQVRGLSEVTFAAWIRRNGPNANVLIGKQTSGHDLAIEAWGDGRVYFGVSNGSYADGYTLLNDTAWHHVVLVFNGRLFGNANRLKAYIDGAQRTLSFEGTIPATTTSNTTPFAIGRIQGDYSSGSVDEVRLYARALTSDEVRSLIEGAPAPAPTVSGVAPTSGPTAGGTAVTISGSGFASGASVSFGGSPATAVSVTSATAISATTPAHIAGAVNVVVTNSDAQSGSCAGCFSYSTPAPTVTGVSPSSGPTAGGTVVTISGSGFATGPGATTIRFAATTATSVSCPSANSCNATSPAGSGVVDVTATVGGLTSATSAADRFTYIASGPPPPTAAGVAPGSGPTAGGSAVTISGTGFAAGATVTFGGSTATAISVTNANSITATTPTHAAGAVNVVVTNTDGQSGTCVGCFSYTAPAPTVTGVTPTNGSTAGGTAVTISGSGFASGAMVSFGGNAATAVSVTSANAISATTPAHAGGPVTVVVTNSDAQSGSCAGCFNYNAPAPTVTGVAPTSGATAGGTAVTISGTGFATGAGATSVRFGATAATAVSCVSANSCSATSPAGTGTVDVTATVGGLTSATTTADRFTYVPAGPPAPTLTGVAPTSGPTAGGTAVTISGSGFASGASVSFGGSPATAVSVTSATAISATTPAHIAGAVNVVVTNSDAQSGSCAGCFSYAGPIGPPPVVNGVSPSTGPSGGGTAVTISGSGFASGAMVSFGGNAATAVSVTSANAISATTPAHAGGPVTVVVTNSDAQSGSCAGCFSYAVPVGAFPLSVSANGRYLQDRNGLPFRIHGDAAWSMISNLTYSEADSYLNDRLAKGFNTVLVNLLEHHFAVNAPANRNGDPPFTTPGNFSTPNEAYFAFVDSLIDLAATKDMVVMLSYMYLGNGGNEGWSAELNNAANTSAVCYDFGLYLGNRYKQRANIIWVAGGDQMPGGGSPGEIRLHRIMDGIKAANGASRLHTAHWISDSVSTDDASFSNDINLNGAYTYSATYDQALTAYRYAPSMPAFLIESGYEAEGWAPGDPASVRAYEYEAYLSGIGGVFYGHRDVWEFATDTWWSGFSFGHQRWQLSLDSPGAFDMMRMGQLFDSVAWWNLVPSNVAGMKRLVTAGGGTYGSNNYVTAAATPDGGTLLAYVPSTGTGARTITIDMSAMSGLARARWFNPTSGAYMTIGSSLPNTGTMQFTTPGNNGAGANDWVLILDRS